MKQRLLHWIKCNIRVGQSVSTLTTYSVHSKLLKSVLFTAELVNWYGAGHIRISKL